MVCAGNHPLSSRRVNFFNTLPMASDRQLAVGHSHRGPGGFQPMTDSFPIRSNKNESNPTPPPSKSKTEQETAYNQPGMQVCQAGNKIPNATTSSAMARYGPIWPSKF